MRAAFRTIVALVLAVTTAVAVTSCRGESGADRPVAPSDPGTPALAPSEPFTEVLSLDWLGPQGQRASLAAWVADTAEERALGLMHRTELPAAAGMLFVFAEDHQGGFWMRNTLIPLSIAYLSAEREVVAVLDMQPCEADPCPVYDPGAPYRYAVEANKGWFGERGIGQGWRVLQPLPAAAG